MLARQSVRQAIPAAVEALSKMTLHLFKCSSSARNYSSKEVNYGFVKQLSCQLGCFLSLLIQNFEKFAYLLNCVLNIKHKYLTFLGN
jgi:hypothetical protein